MIETTSIARPYAQAAFSQAQEEQQVPAWGQALESLTAIVFAPEMQGLLHHPKLDRSQLFELIADIGGRKFSNTQKNFISILIDADRLTVANVILSLFRDYQQKAENVVAILVKTPYPLTAAQTQHLSKTMAKQLDKKITINNVLDPSLIGGALLQFSDSVIDLSLRGRLHTLGDALTN